MKKAFRQILRHFVTREPVGAELGFWQNLQPHQSTRKMRVAFKNVASSRKDDHTIILPTPSNALVP
jgi:hypothetical protein